MTETKQLSLHGRLRMAAACPDANSSLFAEAADAIEQHEAYKQEVSDGVVKATHTMAAGKLLEASGILAAFIIPKTDPLVEVINDADDMVRKPDAPSYAEAIRAALAARGLEVRKIGEGE